MHLWRAVACPCRYSCDRYSVEELRDLHPFTTSEGDNIAGRQNYTKNWRQLSTRHRPRHIRDLSSDPSNPCVLGIFQEGHNGAEKSVG